MQNKRIKRNCKQKGIIRIHIENNFRHYILVTIIFLVGIVFGVLSINNAAEDEQQEISTYINGFIEKGVQEADINYTSLFISSLKKNLWLALCLWFAGLTVIGVFVVYGIVGFRGFTLRI